MNLRRNLPFVIGVAAIGVVFVVVAVFVQRGYSGWNKVKQDDAQAEEELDNLRKMNPNAEHLEYAKKELADTEQAYDKLKELMCTWWDAGVYEEDRTPGIFLGNLQELRRRITLFAIESGVVLDANVPLMGFPELQTSVPPTEVTFDMLKQKSIMRDIILLLIQNKVQSVNAINWIGPEKGGKLYNKYLLNVSFTCKYPQLAKFQADLVNPSRTPVVLKGDKNEKSDRYELPRNYLVIEQISYEADDLKMARLAAAGTPATTTTGTTTTTTIMHGGRPIPDSSHQLGGSGSMAPPNTDPRRRRNPGATTPSGATTTGGGPARATVQHKDAREPLYNILNVTMTISMVDFGEGIRGKLPVEEEKKTGTAARTAATQ
ncbi:MAG: Amuc_1100 family pilus-like protein [Verrucomicrobia bacterium]|nr:Amuc_1100 family pilus-like protein [Verrucomicrobiota bacterium]